MSDPYGPGAPTDRAADPAVPNGAPERVGHTLALPGTGPFASNDATPAADPLVPSPSEPTRSLPPAFFFTPRVPGPSHPRPPAAAAQPPTESYPAPPAPGAGYPPPAAPAATFPGAPAPAPTVPTQTARYAAPPVPPAAFGAPPGPYQAQTVPHPAAGTAAGWAGTPQAGRPAGPTGERSRSRIVPVLAAAAAVLLVLAVVFAGLYANQLGQQGRAEHAVAAQLSAKEQALQGKDRQIDDLNQQLTAARADAETARQQMAAGQTKATTQAAQKQSVTRCVQASAAYVDAAARSDVSKARAALAVMRASCPAAAKATG